MIERILPSKITGVDMFGDATSELIFEEEEEQIREVVPKRRNEYISVRCCARIALRRMGLPPSPLPKGDGGAPRWPWGVVGSMTHCVRYRAAVTAFSSDYSSIGIDAERNEKLPDEVTPLVITRHEEALLRQLRESPFSVQWDTLFFCAKEALFKAWYPLTKEWLGFEDAHVSLVAKPCSTPSSSYGAFHARPSREFENRSEDRTGFFPSVRGKWQCRDGIITTCAYVEAH